jgi:hypothetical protein
MWHWDVYNVGAQFEEKNRLDNVGDWQGCNNSRAFRLWVMVVEI